MYKEGCAGLLRITVEIVKTTVDNFAAYPYTPLVAVAFLLDRGAYRSLTIDTMCQNPFVPSTLFERRWFE